MAIDFKNHKNVKIETDEELNRYAKIDGLSLQNLFYSRKKTFPSCYLYTSESRGDSDSKFDTDKLLSAILEKYSSCETELVTYKTKQLTINGEGTKINFVIIIDNKLFCRFEPWVGESYVLYDNEDDEFAEEFIEFSSRYFIKPKTELDTYYRLCAAVDGYYTSKGKIKFFKDFDIDKLYNDDFKKEDVKIREFINEDNKSGLVVLHGDKGTGKSTYIKYLIHLFPEKKFVYVPSNLVNLIGDPSFGSFLTSLDNSIIVLEDCENVIQDRKITASASAVSLLLNLTDGILSDDLSIKFICTFNDKMNTIDSALLRKGRLVSKFEFKPLCVEKTQNILNSLGYTEKITKPLPLCDIFNYEEESYTNNINKII